MGVINLIVVTKRSTLRQIVFLSNRLHILTRLLLFVKKNIKNIYLIDPVKNAHLISDISFLYLKHTVDFSKYEV